MGWSDYGYPDVDRASLWKSITGLLYAIYERRYVADWSQWWPQRFQPLSGGARPPFEGEYLYNPFGRYILNNYISELESVLQDCIGNNSQGWYIKPDAENLFIDEGDGMALNPDAIITWDNLPDLLQEDIITVDSLKQQCRLVPYFKQRYRIINLLNHYVYNAKRSRIPEEIRRGYSDEYKPTADAAWQSAISNLETYNNESDSERAQMSVSSSGNYYAWIYTAGFYPLLPQGIPPYDVQSDESKPCNVWFYAKEPYVSDYDSEFYSTQYVYGINKVSLEHPYVINNTSYNNERVFNYHFLGQMPQQPPADTIYRGCKINPIYVDYYPDFEFKAQE